MVCVPALAERIKLALDVVGSGIVSVVAWPNVPVIWALFVAAAPIHRLLNGSAAVPSVVVFTAAGVRAVEATFVAPPELLPSVIVPVYEPVPMLIAELPLELIVNGPEIAWPTLEADRMNDAAEPGSLIASVTEEAGGIAFIV